MSSIQNCHPSSGALFSWTLYLSDCLASESVPFWNFRNFDRDEWCLLAPPLPFIHVCLAALLSQVRNTRNALTNPLPSERFRSKAGYLFFLPVKLSVFLLPPATNCSVRSSPCQFPQTSDSIIHVGPIVVLHMTSCTPQRGSSEPFSQFIFRDPRSNPPNPKTKLRFSSVHSTTFLAPSLFAGRSRYTLSYRLTAPSRVIKNRFFSRALKFLFFLRLMETYPMISVSSGPGIPDHVIFRPEILQTHSYLSLFPPRSLTTSFFLVHHLPFE